MTPRKRGSQHSVEFGSFDSAVAGPGFPQGELCTSGPPPQCCVWNTRHDGDMHMPTVLAPGHLPEQELISATLDGELQRVGGAYCPVDTIVSSAHRAASIAAEAPDWAIAEQYTAAWIYGATLDLRRPLHLCVDSRTRMHPISTRLHVFREVVIDEQELLAIGGIPVTSPLRTAIDLARFSAEFSESDHNILRRLSVMATFDFADCVTAVNDRRNLPNKHRALLRLKAALV